YNSLLAGFAIGFLFKVSFLSILLTTGTSILTFLLSHALYTMLTKRSGLPVLNIPFVIVSTMVYLASVRYSSLFVDSFYPFQNLNIDGIPAAVQGLLRAAGILVFMPYDLSGFLLLGSLLLFSRILFFLAVSSYFFGMLVLAMLKGSFALACAACSAFTFVLIGLALGRVFLVPSARTSAFA
ncbi:MAG: urea transporter, partial [bacterium]|nr:urea transporter [bacterium]